VIERGRAKKVRDRSSVAHGRCATADRSQREATDDGCNRAPVGTEGASRIGVMMTKHSAGQASINGVVVFVPVRRTPS
jgi:hypothetical protein